MTEISKNILIISATPEGLASTGSYLSGYGWSVTRRNDLKEALLDLASLAPDVVLVCMDHPSKGIQALPQLISERIRCCVIGTTEEATVENYRLLQDIKSDYKLFPPSTGPAVQKIFTKYVNKMNSLTDVRGSYHTKRSGISPKIFRLDLKAEKVGNDFEGLDLFPTSKFRPAFEEPAPANHLLARGTELLLGELLADFPEMEATTPVYQPLTQTTQITCMLIECEHFQGYLVAAVGNDCHLDEEFNSVVQKHLIEFLNENGETVAGMETFNMNIKPVAFLEWASDYADFLRKSIHKKNELAFAFFPLEGLPDGPQASVSDDMLSLPLEEMLGEAPVGFDLYIFFPANKKFVLYTPAGSVFYNHQKVRLAERGIERLYLRRNDRSDLNRYRAQKYFNAIVDEYVSSADGPA